MGSGVGHLVLSGPLILAVPIAAAAGALTFLSPCVLPLVPGYLSYVTGMSGMDAQAAAATEATEGGLPSAGGPGADDVSGGAMAVKVTVPALVPSPRRSRAVAGTALFVLGFSAVFATEGVAFGGLGSVLRTHTAGLTQVLGVITIVLGLLFAGVFDRFP